MKKALTKAKTLIAKHLKITKETRNKVYFEVTGFKGSYNKGMKQAPEWFIKWAEEDKKQNNKRFDTLESKIDKNTKAIKALDSRVTNLVNKNDLTE